MKNIIIFDIDGTLSDCSDRRKQLEKDGNFEKFEAACGQDKQNKDIMKFLNLLMELKSVPTDKRYSHPFLIYILSGRNEKYKGITQEWLDNYSYSSNYDLILMRKNGDTRPDTEVKAEMVKYFKDDILFVVDDRKKVVDMWRSMGITCLQCADFNG